MAKHVSDFTKSSDNIVLDLINEQNGTALTLAMIDTKVVGDPDTKSGQLLVTAKPTSGYRGSVALNYNRIMLAEMFGAFIPEGDAVEVDNSMTVAEVIALVNTRYGVNLTEKDIYANGTDLVTGGQTMVDVEFDQVTTLNLSANFMNPLVSSSGVPQLGKVWTGMYGLRLTKTAQALSDAWGTTTLDGLYPPGTGSPAEDMGAYSYQGAYWDQNVADMANVGQTMKVATDVQVLVWSTQNGDGVNHSIGGYVTVMPLTSGMQQIIEAPGGVKAFGKHIAISPNGLRLAISTSEIPDEAIANNSDQHMVSVYSRASLEDEFLLDDTFAPTGLVGVPYGEGQTNYSIGGVGWNGMTWVGNDLLAYLVVEDSEWDAARTNNIQFLKFGADGGPHFGGYSVAIPDAVLTGGIFNTRIVLRNEQNFDVVFAELAGGGFSTVVHSLTVGANESFELNLDTEFYGSWPAAYTPDGNRMLLGDGRVMAYSAIEGGPMWVLVKELQPLVTSIVEIFLTDATYINGGFAILSDMVAQNVNTTQSAVLVFHEDGPDSYTLYATLRCPRDDESSDRASRMDVFAATRNGINVFGVEGGKGADTDAQPPVYDFGVIHRWRYVEIS